MKVALYARYSTDMQSQNSIEDQFRICRERATREGWTVVAELSDRAISGATMLRPGLQDMMAMAKAGEIDFVLSEALDRLSRDQEDIAHIYKLLTFHEVALFTLSEGEINELHIGLKGTMNTLFLKELANKTRRGLQGRALEGKSAGGRCFGYETLRQFNQKGEVIDEERRIVPEEAAIVRRIFEDYLKGKSPRKIAAELNAEGIESPTGKGWGQTTINGNRRRGTGILNNELYIGRMIWNRLRYVKDPKTRKRVSRLNPESEWVITELPELRIIDDETWEAVRRYQRKLDAKPAFNGKRRPPKLLSYLLQCGGAAAAWRSLARSATAAHARATKACATTRSPSARRFWRSE